ncbi:hypothetical protein R3P38DRAFT_2529773, partial [Favolaschia claudopus]
LLSKCWSEVTQSTIANCWKHTQIYPKDSDDLSASPLRAAWDIVLEFATQEMSLPTAEKRLAAVLGPGYIPAEGNPYPALTAVMDAENDVVAAEKAVRDLMPDFSKLSIPTSNSLPPVIAKDHHLKEAEKAFSDTLEKLRNERCIRETVSLDELLDPLIEREDSDSEFLRFSDGDAGICEIVALVRKRADENEEEEEVEPEEPEFHFTNKDALDAVDLLQKITRNRPDLEGALSYCRGSAPP